MKAAKRTIPTVFLVSQQSTIEEPPSLYNLANGKEGGKEEMVVGEKREEEGEEVREEEVELAPLCGHTCKDVLDTLTVKDLHIQISSDVA